MGFDMAVKSVDSTTELTKKLDIVVQQGVDSGAASGISGTCPYPAGSEESKYWYRARLLKMQRPDWTPSRIREEIEKRKRGRQ